MEFIEGRDLRWIVSSGGPLSIDQAIDCTIQAARGLDVAHQRGIVHRDIKPANLMLDASGVVRVLDLGLARLVEASGIMEASATDTLTQTGSYMGTVDYSAPEQADDARTVDHRADIYSLGCTLYFLAAGRPPFEGDSVIKKLMAHQNRPAPSLHSVRSDVPAPLEAAYQAMMAKQSADRPAIHERGDLAARERPPAGLRPAEDQQGIDHIRRWKADAFRAEGARRGAGAVAATPALVRPGDGRPFDPDPGVYDLEFDDTVTEGSAKKRSAEDGTDSHAGRERPPVLSGLWIVGACGALAVLGAVLAWTIESSRASRRPEAGGGPRSSAVANPSPSRPDWSQRPGPTRRTPFDADPAGLRRRFDRSAPAASPGRSSSDDLQVSVPPAGRFIPASDPPRNHEMSRGSQQAGRIRRPTRPPDYRADATFARINRRGLAATRGRRRAGCI